MSRPAPTCVTCGVVKRWCRWCHRPHCQCPGHRPLEGAHTRKYPKWGWVFVVDLRSGKTIKVSPRWWAIEQGRRKAMATVRARGQQHCFDSETARKAVLKRWRHTRKSKRTGKYFVKLATARRLQHRAHKK